MGSNAGDLAAHNYGSCKQYLDTANALRGSSGRAFHEDTRSSSSEVGASVLSGFESMFGISGSDLMGRLLGAGSIRDELGEITKSKIGADTLAKAFDGAAKPENFEVKLARSSNASAKKSPDLSAMRESLRARLAVAASDDGAPASAGQAPAGQRFKGLEPLRDGIFNSDASSVELTRKQEL